MQEMQPYHLFTTNHSYIRHVAGTCKSHAILLQCYVICESVTTESNMSKVDCDRYKEGRLIIVN